MSDELKIRLLVVDDEQSIRRLCMTIGNTLGFACSEAESAEAALANLEAETPDLVLADLKLPNLSGVEFLRQMKAILPRTEVAIMTGHGSIESAVDAMKLGAYDYIEKPFRVEKMRLLLQRMAEKVRLITENQFLRERVSTEENLDGIVGASAKIQDVLRMISRLKDTRTPVLIVGESGTGKELVARAIHFRGAMAQTPFVAVDCGSLVPTLMESELFGYEKGAFTGAVKSKHGLFQAADGGTIFLDEIGELPQEMQAKLLRVLQEKEVRPVGSNERVTVDVRVIAATNRDLEAAYRAGTFRKDLYFRLNVVTVHLPASFSRGIRAGRKHPGDAGNHEKPFAIRLAGKHPRTRELHRTGRDARRSAGRGCERFAADDSQRGRSRYGELLTDRGRHVYDDGARRDGTDDHPSRVRTGARGQGACRKDAGDQPGYFVSQAQALQHHVETFRDSRGGRHTNRVRVR